MCDGRVTADDLEHGQAIEFEVDGRLRIAMVLSTLPANEFDFATHILEFVDVQSFEEIRVRLDGDTSILTGDRAPEGVPYTYKGCHLPALPAHKQHYCTDGYFLILFLFALAGFAWVAYYALTHGDISRLHHTFDWQGRMCGVDEGVTDKKFSFWCKRPPVNQTERAANKRRKKKEDTDTALEQLADQITDGVEHITYLILPNKTAEPELLEFHWPICVKECPDTNNTFHECYNNRSTIMMRDYPSKNFGYSRYCWPKEDKFLEQVKKVRAEHLGSKGKALMSVPRYAWLVFPIEGVVAALMGFCYFKLLEKCVDFIVMVFILSATSLTLVSGSMTIYFYYGHRQCWIGFVLILFGVVACKTLLAPTAQANINKAAGCIEAACECINQELSLLIEPFLAIIVRLTLLIFLLAVGLMLVTCGEPTAFKDGSNRGRFEFTWEITIYIGYTIFMAFWLMEISTSLSQYVLAWVTERWYFTPYVGDKKLDWKRRAIFKGYGNALRYHMGTLSKGSLLIMFLRYPRIVFKLVCGWQCIAHIGKNAYLGTALTSEPFHRAARSAHYMMNSNEDFGAVRWLNGLQGIFQFGGLGVICAASGAFTYVACYVSEWLGPDVKVREIIICMAMLASLPIGLGYMTLFDTVGDTILYCWAVQQSRYNYHFSHQQQQVSPVDSSLSTAYQVLFGDGAEEGNTTKVNYAPIALRELVLGRHRKLINVPCLPNPQGRDF